MSSSLCSTSRLYRCKPCNNSWHSNLLPAPWDPVPSTVHGSNLWNNDKKTEKLHGARGDARGVTQAVMMVLQKGGRHNIIATCPPSAMQRSRSRQGGTGVAMLPVGRASRVEDPSTETAP